METEALFASRQLLQERTQVDHRLVYLAEVGSRAQGVTQAASDFDTTAIWVESFADMVSDRFKASRQIRTQPDGVRSGPGDVDVNLYTARHVTHLMLKGNPSVQEALASNNVMLATPEGQVLVWAWELRHSTFSRKSLKAYLGYMTQQYERWKGNRGQKNVTRPELVEKYGYDTKYVGHIYRLAQQARLYVESEGSFELPYPQDVITTVQGIRQGKLTEGSAELLVKGAISAVEAMVENAVMPDVPDYEAAWAATEALYWAAYNDAWFS